MYNVYIFKYVNVTVTVLTEESSRPEIQVRSSHTLPPLHPAPLTPFGCIWIFSSFHIHILQVEPVLSAGSPLWIFVEKFSKWSKAQEGEPPRGQSDTVRRAEWRHPQLTERDSRATINPSSTKYNKPCLQAHTSQSLFTVTSSWLPSRPWELESADMIKIIQRANHCQLYWDQKSPLSRWLQRRHSTPPLYWWSLLQTLLERERR